MNINRQKLPVALGKALSISVLNQGLSSLANLFLGVYLVRNLSPNEFGLYGIGIATSLYYSGIGNALVLTQMVVHSADKEPDDRLSYAARMFIVVLLLSLLSALVILCIITGGMYLFPWLRDHYPLCLSTLAAALAYFVKDFFIRQAYVAQEEKKAFAINLATLLVLALIIALAESFGIELLATSALLVYTVSQLSGALTGWVFSELPVFDLKWSDVRSDIGEAWSGGRWALGGVTVTWIQSQAHTYVTALFFGAAGVGYINAGRLFIAPLLFLVPAVSAVAVPRLAELRNTDPRKMIRVGRGLTVAMLGLSSIYAFGLYVGFTQLDQLLLGHKYQQIGVVVSAWCLVLFCQFSRVGASTLLQVLKKFRGLMLANLLTLVVAIPLVFLLVKFYGPSGAVTGTALGELCLALLLWRVVVDEQKNTG